MVVWWAAAGACLDTAACGPLEAQPGPPPAAAAASAVPVGRLLTGEQTVCSAAVVGARWLLTSAACGRLAMTAQLTFRPPPGDGGGREGMPVVVREVVLHPSAAVDLCTPAAPEASHGLDAGAEARRQAACARLAAACQVDSFHRLSQATRACLQAQPADVRLAAGLDGLRDRLEVALMRLETPLEGLVPAPLGSGRSAGALPRAGHLAVVGHAADGAPERLLLAARLGERGGHEIGIDNLAPSLAAGGVVVGHVVAGAPLAIWAVGGRPCGQGASPAAAGATRAFGVLDPAAVAWVESQCRDDLAWPLGGGPAAGESAPAAAAAGPRGPATAGGCRPSQDAAGAAPAGAVAMLLTARAARMLGRRRRGGGGPGGRAAGSRRGRRAAWGAWLVAVGCGGEPPVWTAVSGPAEAAALVGGVPAAVGAFAEVGAVRRLGGAGAAAGLCTGTLVAPNAVLTAAHCLEGEARVGEWDLQELPPLGPRWGFVTGGAALPASTAGLHWASEVVRHPSYHTIACRDDEPDLGRQAACDAVQAALDLASRAALRRLLVEEGPDGEVACPGRAAQRRRLAELDEGLLRRAGMLGPAEAYDVALLFLATPLIYPAPARLAETPAAGPDAGSLGAPAALRPGAMLLTAGYGSDTEGRTPSAAWEAGRKRWLRLPVEALGPVELQVGGAPAQPSFGDSGAPLFTDPPGHPPGHHADEGHGDVPRLVGVASRLADLRRDTAGGGALFTRLDAVRGWLDHELACRPPPPPPPRAAPQDDPSAAALAPPAAGCVAGGSAAGASTLVAAWVAVAAAARRLGPGPRRLRRARRSPAG